MFIFHVGKMSPNHYQDISSNIKNEISVYPYEHFSHRMVYTCSFFSEIQVFIKTRKTSNLSQTFIWGQNEIYPPPQNNSFLYVRIHLLLTLPLTNVKLFDTNKP